MLICLTEIIVYMSVAVVFTRIATTGNRDHPLLHDIENWERIPYPLIVTYLLLSHFLSGSFLLDIYNTSDAVSVDTKQLPA